MSPNLLKYIAVFFGAVSVTVSIIFGNAETVYFKPFFHVFIALFYIRQTKKVNWFLLGFLFFAAIGETLIARSFENNYEGLMLLFSLAFMSGFIALIPVLNETKMRVKWTDLFIGVVVLAGVTYLITSVFILTSSELNEFTYLTIGLLAFCTFIFSNLYVSVFNKHPRKLYLFITGSGYLVICLGAFLYEILYKSAVLLGIINAAEVVAQLSFVYFFAHISDFMKKKKWFI